MEAALEQIQTLKSDIQNCELPEELRQSLLERLDSVEKTFRRTSFKADRSLKEKHSFQLLITQLSKDLSEKIEESEHHAEQLGDALSKLRHNSEELERRNEQLKIAEAKALDASLAKSQFLAKMTHELRTPMNGFLGMLQLLEMTELSDEQRHFVDTMRSAGGSLMNLIEPILDFSKIEAGKLELMPVVFNLHDELQSTIDLFLPIAEKEELEIDLNYDENAPKVIIGDQYRLRQVFSNLLSNALKFSNEGTIEISVQLQKKSQRTATSRFEFKDSGIGIPADRLESLFESFNQVDNSSTRKYGGSGLGLAVCKDLIELMGGNIKVESELGVGSRFYFDLEFPISR